MTEWSDLNPLLQWCDNYELQDIWIDEGLRSTGEGSTVEKTWTVMGEYTPDWSDKPVMFAETYTNLQKSQEVYHRIIRMARKVYWTYDQPPIGKLPQ